MMHRRNFIYLFSVLLFINYEYSNSQELTSNIVYDKDAYVGHCFNKDITGTKIHFPDYIYRVSNDSLDDEIVLLLRKASGKVYKNKGYLVAIRKSDLKISWSTEVSDFEMFSTDSLVLLSNIEKNKPRAMLKTAESSDGRAII